MKENTKKNYHLNKFGKKYIYEANCINLIPEDIQLPNPLSYYHAMMEDKTIDPNHADTYDF